MKDKKMKYLEVLILLRKPYPQLHICERSEPTYWQQVWQEHRKKPSVLEPYTLINEPTNFVRNITKITGMNKLKNIKGRDRKII